MSVVAAHRVALTPVTRGKVVDGEDGEGIGDGGEALEEGEGRGGRTRGVERGEGDALGDGERRGEEVAGGGGVGTSRH